MNKRQVIILWAIALALGVAVAAVKISQKESAAGATQRAPGETLLASFPAGEVASIEVSSLDESVTLRQAEGAWVVAQRDDYPANPAAVNELLRGLGELKVTQGIEAGPSFAPSFGMDPEASTPENRGMTATFTNAAGKELAKVSFGKNIEGAASSSPFGGGAVGRYVRNHADESGFYKVSEVFPSLSADPKRWLQDGFVQIEKIQSVSVTEPGSETIAWAVTRPDESAEFSLATSVGEEAADPTATAPIKSLFSYARFDDVIPADQVAARAETDQKRTAVIETFEGFTYTIHFSPLRQQAPQPAGDDLQAPASESYALTIDVNAEIPSERKPEEGETEDDATIKDAAFTERQTTLSERLAKERKLAGRHFEVSKYVVEPLLKPRVELAAPATAPTAGPAPGQVAPVTTRPIEAVTPPIAIPPYEPETAPEPQPEPAAEEAPAE